MTRRLLIPISLIFCFFTKAYTQTPVPVTTEAPVAAVAGFSSMVCPFGVTAFAGTVNLTLAPAAQTNDIEFLCINDVLNIDHLGGQTFGDPDPSSAPGISYVFYSCAPTESGPDFATVASDPCLINNPPPPANSFYASPSTNGNGDAVFTNTGLIQTTFNSGDPIELFFAPITIDDFATNGFETDGVGGPVGPCINVNISEAFRVVYLNEIEATNINTAAQGSCTGSFTVLGGLPEFDNSNYTNFTITSNTNPGVNGMLVTATNYSHGDNVLFSVPEPGTYTITIEDGKSCAGSFTVNMNNCIVVETIAGEEVTGVGESVCVPITANGFTDILSFQYIIQFDPTILQFDSINEISLPNQVQSGNPSAGVITISWSDETFVGQTFGPMDVLYEVCFTAIGALGTSSDIVFTGDFTTPVELISAATLSVVGSSFNNGSVTIANSVFTLSYGVCTSLTGAMDGSFTVIPTGGTPDYNFSWVMQGNPGVNGMATVPDVVSNLNPGTYNVTVTDDSGSTVTGSVVIPNMSPLTLETTPSNPSCSGNTNGIINVSFENGIAPYMVLWSTGDMDINTLDDLPAGDYSVSITDGLGCVVSEDNTLVSPPPLTITANQQNITCPLGANSGSISVNAVGGTIPYTYSWSNGATTATISNLAAGGPYTVTATDLNSCIAVENYTITEPTGPMIQFIDSMPVECQNQMTGSLTVNATPGSAPITSYLWSDPNSQTTQTATMLAAGTYTVTVTDDEGCSDVGTASLFAPSPMNVSMTINQNSCANINDGQIILTVTGGSGTPSFNWSTSPTNLNILLALACGEDNPYSVTITDDCEAIVIDTFIVCPSSVVASLDPLSLPRVSCFNEECDAQQLAFGSGGSTTTGLYNFNWSSGEVYQNVASSTAEGLCQGEQWVVVSDNFCQDTAFFMVEAPSPLSFDLSPAATFGTQVSCFGESDGAYTVTASGGTPDYDYLWANPATTGATISGVPAGNYIVTVTDANNCKLVSGFQIVQPALFEVFIDSMQTSDAVNCAGGEDGQISVYSLGGNPGLNTYNWAPGISENTSLVTGLSAGTYSVTVTDPKGCPDNILFTIAEPDPIMAVIADIVEPLCNGDQTVVTIDTVYGGSGLSYRFSVDFGPPQFPTSFIPILAGEHTIQVFDDADCAIEFTINVSEPAPVIVDLGEDIELELGDSIQLKPIILVQGVPIDTLFWDPLYKLTCIDTANDTICQRPWISPLETTTYELMVVDTNGCVGRDEIIVKIDRNRNVYIPNAFTPNADGINDILKIYTGLGVSEVNYFRIFDRWGEQVYARDRFLPQDNDFEGWDGRLNGKIMNSGVYVYIAEVVFIDGRVLLYRGDIALIY